jgi:hypothetical protein
MRKRERSLAITCGLALCAGVVISCTQPPRAGPPAGAPPAAARQSPPAPPPAQASPPVAQAPPGAPPAGPARPQVELDGSFQLEQEAGREVSHMPAVVFTPDGKRLVTGTSAGEVIVWDAATRAVKKRMKFADSAILALALIPDKVLVALLENGALEVIDPASGKVVAAEEKVAAAKTLVLSPDGTHVAIARGSGIEVRALPGLAVEKVVADAHAGEVTNLAVSPDGARLASVGRDGRLRMWSFSTLAPAWKIEGTAPLYAVAFSPDGARVAFGGEERAIDEVPAGGGAPRRVREGQPFWITSLGYSPDGKRIACGDESCDIWLFEAASGAEIFHGKHHVECWLSSVAWAPDSETFLFGCRPNSLAGKPSVYAANLVAEVAQQADLQKLAQDRAAAEQRAWDGWTSDASPETLAIRAKVRAKLAKRLSLADDAAHAAEVDRAERQWLAGRPAAQALSASTPAVSTISGLAFDAPSEVQLDLVGAESPNAGAISLALTGEGAFQAAVRMAVPAPLDPELAELRKQAEARADIAAAEDARKRYDETVRERVEALGGKFILNQWRAR